MYTILPPTELCGECGRSITCADFIDLARSAGHEPDLMFMLVRKDCCMERYKRITPPVHPSRKEHLAKLTTFFSEQKNVMYTDSEKVAMSFYYLQSRGVGVKVISHLLQVPLPPFVVSRSPDCTVCESVVPNKDFIKTLITEGMNSLQHANQYDIPRRCCMEAIINGEIEADVLEDHIAIPVVHRGVPVMEDDYVKCRECRTVIGGCADFPLDKVGPWHISGDCIRQAARWGLPTEYGFVCHNVRNGCCRSSIINPITQILASEEFDIRAAMRNSVDAMYYCQ